MTTIVIEMPLWVVICIIIALFLLIIHLMIGDFLKHIEKKNVTKNERTKKDDKGTN